MAHLKGAKVLSTQGTLDEFLSLGPLVIRPYLHTLDVNTLSTAKLAVGDGRCLGEQLLLTDGTHIINSNILLDSDFITWSSPGIRLVSLGLLPPQKAMKYFIDFSLNQPELESDGVLLGYAEPLQKDPNHTKRYCEAIV